MPRPPSAEPDDPASLASSGGADGPDGPGAAVGASCIALLTDFGVRDTYVGQMKGVLAARAPAARVIDLSHHVPPQDIRVAALWLLDAAPAFPADTIHLAVVDPGVGTERAILAARAGGRFFVGPDNGLFAPILATDETAWAVRVERSDLYLTPPCAASHTFHGRDRFAPVAAAIATGMTLAELGPRVQDWVGLTLPEPCRTEAGGLKGEVLYLDHFGNAVTNLRVEDLVAAGLLPACGLQADPGDPVPMAEPGPSHETPAHVNPTPAGKRTPSADAASAHPPSSAPANAEGAPSLRVDCGEVLLRGIEATYAAVAPGQVLALFGSSGRLEISVRDGSAAARLALAPGASVSVHPTAS